MDEGGADMIRAVVFDMDGLMFDTERLCALAWDEAGRQMGIGPAGYMNQKTLGLTLPMARKVWRATFGEGFDFEELDRLTHAFFSRYYAEKGVPVKPGLYELLDYLKGHHYKIAVASSTQEAEVRKYLTEADVLSYFDAVVGGDRLPASKPAPDIYLKACSELGELPENCMALEDSRNGLLSAIRAGLKAVMIPDQWQPDDEIQALLYAKCGRLDEVIGLLEKEKTG